MFTTIPVSWRERFGANVTSDDLNLLNDTLAKLHIPAIIFLVILMTVGVVGNVLVLYIYKMKYKPAPYRNVILWLASLDMISCSVGVPLMITSMVYPYMFPSEDACKTLRFLHIFLVASSAFIVIALAIERHWAICYPFSLLISTKNITMMCFVSFALGAILAVPAIFVYGAADVDTGVNNITGTECFIDPDYKGSKFTMYYFIGQITVAVVSMVIMGILYIRIGIEISTRLKFVRENTFSKRQMSNNDQKDTDSLDSDMSSTREMTSRPTRETTPRSTRETIPRTTRGTTSRPTRRKRSRLSSKSSTSSKKPSHKLKQMTYMAFLVTLVFILAFIPHLVLIVTVAINPEFVKGMSVAGIVFYNIGLRSLTINNMANPIIYAFCDDKFRYNCSTLCISILKCWRKSDKNNTVV